MEKQEAEERRGEGREREVELEKGKNTREEKGQTRSEREGFPKPFSLSQERYHLYRVPKCSLGKLCQIPSTCSA